MLRLIIQTKRKYKKSEKQVIEHKDEEGIADKTENCSTDDESGDGQKKILSRLRSKKRIGLIT